MLTPSGANHLLSLAIFFNFADLGIQDSADASTYISFLCLCYVTISDLFLELHIIILYSLDQSFGIHLHVPDVYNKYSIHFFIVIMDELKSAHNLMAAETYIPV